VSVITVQRDGKRAIESPSLRG